ncbi:MAG: DUF4249 domain-containing protein [Bacteroidetes bacterium]|nr:DUF4249 domain-containing protein [Bacteroidota bacterium]
MQKKKIFILLIFILISCTKEISIDLPKKEPKLIVNSFFIPFTTPNPKSFNVKVNQSSPLLDTTTMKAITDATVIISSGNQIDTMKYNDSSDYYDFSDFTFPETGKNYELKIIKSGFKTVTSNDLVPNRVEMTSYEINPIAGTNDCGDIYSEITINFCDPANEKNFYEMEISDEISYQIFSNDNIITSESYYPSLLSFDAENPEYLLFNDSYINGEKHQLRIFYYPPQYIDPDGRYIDNQVVFLHFRSVSENYYKYKTSLLQHLYRQQGDILYGTGEPVNVFSNIENGYGIFAGYQEDTETILIKTTKVK